MLFPYISDAVEKYYGESRQYTEAGILNIVKTDNGAYKLKVKFETFVGAHNPPYGKDILTISYDNSQIKVENFHHEDAP